MTVVRFDTVPTASGLDAALDGARVALVSVPGEARAELIAACLERGLAVVARVPFASEPAGAAMLRARYGQRPARLVPWITALVDPATKRAQSSEVRAMLGGVTRVEVTAPDEHTARTLLAHVGAGVADTVAHVGSVLSVVWHGTRARVEIRWEKGDDHPATMTLARGTETRVVVAPSVATVDDLARYVLHGDRPVEAPVREAAIGLHEGSPVAPVAGDRAGWQRVTDLARDAVDDAAVCAAAGLVRVAGEGTPAGALVTDDEQILPYLEAFAYEQGIKPALYLTVPRDEVADVRARFAGHAIESVPYACELDAVTDVRHRRNTSLEHSTHADLFVSRDASVAARARAIYEDPRGPSAHLGAMGTLLGYPACCVAAFDALPDRSNNSAIRYAAYARTHALGEHFAAEIANLAALVVPFFPCSYACPHAVDRARAVLAALDAHDPSASRELRRRLARPVFYVDHARQLAFEGAHVTRHDDAYTVNYTAVRGGLGPRDVLVGERFEHAVGRWFAAGDRAVIDTRGITIERAGTLVVRFERCAPGLGRLFPFGT